MVPSELVWTTKKITLFIFVIEVVAVSWRKVESDPTNVEFQAERGLSDVNQHAQEERAANSYENNISTLINNAVYGKSLEREEINLFQVSNERHLCKCVSTPRLKPKFCDIVGLSSLRKSTSFHVRFNSVLPHTSTPKQHFLFSTYYHQVRFVPMVVDD